MRVPRHWPALTHALQITTRRNVKRGPVLDAVVDVVVVVVVVVSVVLDGDGDGDGSQRTLASPEIGLASRAIGHLGLNSEAATFAPIPGELLPCGED